MSSSKAAQGARQRRLLAKVQHSIHPATIVYALPYQEQLKDVIEPLVVQCCSSSKVSVTLAFDMLTSTGGYYNVDVELRNVDAPNMTLQIEATVEWYKRRADMDVSRETNKSTWPDPEPPVKVTLDGEGRIGSFNYRTLRSLSVHLEVYALNDRSHSAPSAMLGGLNALRLKDTLADVELKADGESFPAHRAVLAANSPVFSSMFASDLKEAQEGYVEIEGTSSTAFGLFLEFLYTANVVDWKGCEIELLELADRYMVDLLQAVCEERLLQMDWRTALGILQHADKPVISSDVRKRAMLVVVKNWEAVHITPQWSDFQASTSILADWVRVARECLLQKP